MYARPIKVCMMGRTDGIESLTKFNKNVKSTFRPNWNGKSGTVSILLDW